MKNRGSLGRNFELDGVTKGSSLELRYFRRHRSGEEVGVTLFSRDDFENVVDDWSKIEVEQTIRFIHDLPLSRQLLLDQKRMDWDPTHKILQSPQAKPFRVLQMILQPSGSSDDDVRFLRQSDRLGHGVHPSNNRSYPHTNP